MFRIMSPASIIVGLVEQLCNRQILLTAFPENTGLLFTLQIRCENYGYEKDGKTHHPEWESIYNKYLHIIVINCHHVFISESDSWDYRDSPLESFKNTSNHDSCWKSDGFQLIFKHYFAAAKNCWDHVPKEHSRPPIFSEVEGSLTPLLRKPFKMVRVTKKRLEDGYFCELTSIKELKFTINVED